MIQLIVRGWIKNIFIYCVDEQYADYNKSDFLSKVKTLKKDIKKILRKIILKVELTLDNFRRWKWNFEGFRSPQNKCSNLILRVKKPLNNLLPKFKIFTFTTLDK